VDDGILKAGVARAVEAAGATFGVQVAFAEVNSPPALARALAEMPPNNDHGLVVTPTPVNVVHRGEIIAFAAREKKPAIYPYKIFVSGGGLVSYGVEPADIYRRAASYVDRIVGGEAPGVLPVQGPTKFELAVNLKTANALGLPIPASLLARADEVIE
jgi:putative ABC transport system substrate-binding protein